MVLLRDASGVELSQVDPASGWFNWVEVVLFDLKACKNGDDLFVVRMEGGHGSGLWRHWRHTKNSLDNLGAARRRAGRQRNIEAIFTQGHGVSAVES